MSSLTSKKNIVTLALLGIVVAIAGATTLAPHVAFADGGHDHGDSCDDNGHEHGHDHGDSCDDNEDDNCDCSCDCCD
jgi:ABC-type Zn2+ transport system substrate-binding protein/surface adhesin